MEEHEGMAADEIQTDKLKWRQQKCRMNGNGSQGLDDITKKLREAWKELYKTQRMAEARV